VLALLLACPAPPAAPWEPDTLLIRALDLPGPALGQSTLVVGTDGTSALIDLGNDRHADAVLERVVQVTGDASVDWVVLTHLHADHIGAADELLSGALQVRQGVIWRGPIDLDQGNAGEVDELLAALQDHSSVALCSEQACELPVALDLGDAELEIFLAAGHVATETGVQQVDVPLSEENAQSLGGVIRLDGFQYVFAGDLTGGGKDTPDVEGAVAALAPVAVAPPVDVVHLNHHGISSSTNAAWVDWLLDAGDAHALVGANGAYGDAPSQQALDALDGHLGAGHVWVTAPGRFGSGDFVDAQGDVAVTVEPGGGYVVDAPAAGVSWAPRRPAPSRTGPTARRTPPGTPRPARWPRRACARSCRA
jgi:hypothetical protein